MSTLLSFPSDLTKLIDQYAEEVYDSMEMGHFTLKEIMQDLHDLSKYDIVGVYDHHKKVTLSNYADNISSNIDFDTGMVFDGNIGMIMDSIREGHIRHLGTLSTGKDRLFMYVDECYVRYIEVYKGIDFMMDKLMTFHFHYKHVVRKIQKYNEYIAHKEYMQRK